MITLMSYLSILSLALLVLVSIVLDALLAKRYVETRVKAVLWLLGAILFTVLSTSVELVHALLNIKGLGDYYKDSSGFLFSFLGIITAGIFLLFIDYFENERISPVKLAISSSASVGYFFPTAVFLLNPDFNPESEGIGIVIFIASYILPFFLVYVVASSYRSIGNVKRYATAEDQIRQLNLLLIVIGLYYGVTFVLGFANSQLFDFGDNSDLILLFNVVLPRSSITAGSLILFFAYARTPKVAWLQPQRMDQLLVISKHGLPIFSHAFRKLPTDDDGSILLSGGLVAIRSLLKEAIGSSSDIIAIKFVEKEIMVVTRENFGVFLITDRASSFLHSALVSFANDFLSNYGQFLSGNQVIQSDDFDSAVILVKETFG